MRYLILLALLGCGGGSSVTEPPVTPPVTPPNNPPPVTPGIAASVAIISGMDQQAPVATELAQAVVVKVTDAQDVPVPGQLVNFVVVSGGGSVFAGSGQTNQSGESRERWTLGTAAGEQILEARAVDATTGAPIVFGRIMATGKPGPVTGLGIRTLTDYTLTAGDTLDLRNVVANGVDQYGNTIWAAPDVQGVKAFGTFEDLQTGVTFWHDSNPGDPTETLGDRFPLREVFDGTVYVWAAGKRFDSFHLLVTER